MTVDLRPILETTQTESAEARGISTMARNLMGSQILKIAYEVRDMIAAGEDLLNLTVGDFSPKEFPIPEPLTKGIAKAIEDGGGSW